MSTFFVTADCIADNKITISGEDAHHISKVLRMAAGDHIKVSDMSKKIYNCKIEGFSRDEVYLNIESSEDSITEPPYKATLFMALPKQDKMELIIQKAVELGVYRIVPFSSSRCVCKLDSQGGEKKRERWQKIAKSGAEQCGRAIIPEVHTPVTFKKALEMLMESQNPFMCYEGEETLSMKQYLDGKKDKGEEFAFMIGSEGGFSVEEARLIRENNVPTVSLGNRILRCETAPLMVLSCLSMMYEM